MGDHRYKLRDYDFAHLLLTLRKRSRLTQEDVALQIGISEKALRNWEGGSHYPSDAHLRKLITVYLHKHVFVSGSEHDEARLLWNQVHERTPHRIGSFDEPWFATLFQEWQAHSTSQAPQAAGDQQRTQSWSGETSLLTPFPALEAEHRNRSSRLLRGDWSEAPDVSLWYGRSDDLAELERWLLADQYRLVAVLGMGGIGKTTLAVKLMQQVAPHFACVLWRSLHNAPSMQDVLGDWLQVLSPQRLLDSSQSLDHLLTLLLEQLQARRCL